MKKLKLMLLLCVACITSAQAQTLSGKLTDEQNLPLAYANVVLLSLPDSAFVAGTITDEDGNFSLADSKKGRLLRFSSIGYTTVYRLVEGSGIGTVRMVSDTQLLGEVVVKGTLPKTQLKGDAMITNVSGTVLEKAGTAENLLDKIPNVSSQDGSIEVFGRGTPEIYINGRKMRNTSELDQLSSDQIKSVEVVNNPGARYDASVKAVIRITTKKTAGEGFGADNRAVARHRRTYGWTLYDQLNLNYRKNGLDLSGTIYGGVFRSGNNQQIGMATHLDKLWEQEIDASYARVKRNNLEATFSANYQFDEHHSVGVRYNIDRYMNTFGDWRYLTQVWSDKQLYETSDSRMLIYDPSTRHDLNLYYSGQVGGWNIDFNADGLWNITKETQHTTETINTTEERQVNTYNENDGTLYAAKLVAAHPLWQGTFAVGGEYSHTNRSNLYLNPEGILSDDDSRIKEGTVSAFADYTRSWGNVNVQAGIRYEHVAFDYYEEGKFIPGQSRKYDNVFPSVSVNFPIGKAQVQLGYAADISRPTYDNLRNNTYYANRYTYQTGNPFLTPTLTQNLTFAASYQWASLSVGYSHVKDAMMQMCENYSDDDPTISLLKVQNTSPYDRLMASLTLAPSIGFWNPQFSVQLYKQWLTLDGADGPIHLNKPMPSFVWRNNFALPAGFVLDVNGTLTLRGNEQNMYLCRNSGNVSLALFKSFCKDRFTVQLQANNLFESDDQDVEMYSGIRTLTNYVVMYRDVRLTLRYKFNTAKSKYKGTGAGESQKARM